VSDEQKFGDEAKRISCLHLARIKALNLLFGHLAKFFGIDTNLPIGWLPGFRLDTSYPPRLPPRHSASAEVSIYG
jgi:hypothetical protein